MLSPEARLPDLLPFVEQQLYFVIHAPRQVGKTTAVIAFAERLRGLGYAAVHASLETSQGFAGVAEAEELWLGQIRRAARIQLSDPDLRPPAECTEAPGNRLLGLLSR